MRLCFATNNEHKLEEAKLLLGKKFSVLKLEDIGCFEELPETTGTIFGNSRQKAAYVHENFNVDCFADDSGLEVEALGNLPGVDSAVYAGPQRSHTDNINLLLKNLKTVNAREARFVTVITLIVAGQTFQFEGTLSGKIINEPRGSGGFGYDSVFVPEGLTKTLAELTIEEKNKISHRAKALHMLIAFLFSGNLYH
jgi:XTP/dITP diphosphohydrolase